MASEVFIVGTNAATALAEDWWKFWDVEYGFRKAAWFESYVANRAKEGKTKVTPTRRVIEWVSEAAGFACLETNVHPKATARAHLLQAADRTRAVLDFLLDTITPHVIVAHGAPARQYWSERLDLKLNEDEVLHVPMHPHPAILIGTAHFSRLRSQDAARALAEVIRAARS